MSKDPAQDSQIRKFKSAVRVSRESGLASEKGTFGLAARFSDKVKGYGKESPADDLYYGRNRLYKGTDEIGREPGLGVGDRPAYISGHRNVGPGSYDPIMSRAKARSPLDGAEFCTRTMKARPKKGSMALEGVVSPGPAYNIKAKVGEHLPKWSLGMPLKQYEDHTGPGPGHNFNDHLSIGAFVGTLSMPDLKSGSKPLDANAKRCVKTTFGGAQRFNYKGTSSTPDKNLYYAHFKAWDAETYLANSRACSMGGGQRTDFGHSQHTAGPGSYSYENYTSSAKKTSPIDGFASRGISPVRYFTKKLPK